MSRIRLLSLATGLLLLAGCMQVEMVFKVRSDGSGTLTTRMTMAKDGPASSMAEMGGEVAMPFTEAGARQAAAQYGPGVTFVRAREIDKGDLVGVETLYKFDNISTVQAAPMSEGQGAVSITASENVRFLFSPEGFGRLTITVPAQEGTVDTEELSDSDINMQAAMLKGMLAGMHIKMSVEIEAGIADANIRNVSDNVLTIYEFDFDRLAADDQNLKDYIRYQNDPARARTIPGFGYPENNPIIIQFGEASASLPIWVFYILGGLLVIGLIVLVATKVEFSIG
jgi:hypothetical protein